MVGSNLPTPEFILSFYYPFICCSVSASTNQYIKYPMKTIPWPESNLKCLMQMRQYIFVLFLMQWSSSYYHASAAVKSQAKGMFYLSFGFAYSGIRTVGPGKDSWSLSNVGPWSLPSPHSQILFFASVPPDPCFLWHRFLIELTWATVWGQLGYFSKWPCHFMAE